MSEAGEAEKARFLGQGHTDPPCPVCEADRIQAASDLAVIRTFVSLANEAIDRRDFELAHSNEDGGHMLITRRAAEGKPWVRQMAQELLPLCERDYPRHCA